jgi:citrate synthase
MLFSVPCEPYRVPTAAVRALDALLIVQADHEQNASTSAMRQLYTGPAHRDVVPIAECAAHEPIVG